MRTRRGDNGFRGQVSLELGGKSPNIVFESANLEQGGSPKPSAVGSEAAMTDNASFRDPAAIWAALGILYNTGKGAQHQTNDPSISPAAFRRGLYRGIQGLCARQCV